jgi:hypothetical protein
MPGAAESPLQLPQRPVPPVHHVWVAAAGDGKRLYRSAFLRTFGVRRLAIYVVALVTVGAIAVIEPGAGIPWLIALITFVVMVAVLVVRRGNMADKYMQAGAVWATGFGANELLVITPINTLIIDYAALSPPRAIGLAVLIRVRHGSTLFLPRELVPPAALSLLQQRCR